MPKVYFVVENQIVEAKRGQTIRQVAQDHGIYLNREYIYHFNCGGRGICGTCRVWARGKESSALSPMTLREKAYGLRGMQRLACQAVVNGDVEIYSVPGGEDRREPDRNIDPPILDWADSASAPDAERGDESPNE